jgi:hypothetical protein
MRKRDNYVDGLDMTQFEGGIIEKISHYNRNYYIGFDSDLLYAKSDDDNTTEWYLINGDSKSVFLGQSYTSHGDKLDVFEEHLL